MQEDSLIITISPRRPELKHEEISRHPETFDWIFCIFLVCFFLSGNIIGKRMLIFSSVIRNLFSIKKRETSFSETTINEWYSKLFLCFQTCLLLSIFLCKYFSSGSDVMLHLPMKTLMFILLLTFILCLFFTVKWAINYFIGWVFFDKSSIQVWTQFFFFLITSSGILLFIPVLLYFYSNTPPIFLFYFILFIPILVEILVVYKSIVLFFYKQSSLLYLFLYLCGQEIIPLFFLWKIMVHAFNNFVENSVLWL